MSDYGIEAVSPSTVFISGQAITEQDALDAIDLALENLYATSDLGLIDNSIDTLLGLQRLSGKSLAKLLHGTEQWWEMSEHKGSFDDHMETRHGLKKVTIDRYICVWENIVNGAIPPALAERPMRDLVPIAKAISQGYELTKAAIGKLIKATSNSEVGDILRTVKGKTARKSALQIVWERDGSLNVWKDNKKTFIGYLDKEVYKTSDDGKKAIERLLGTGVKVK